MKTHVLLIDDCPNISLMLKLIVERYFSNDVRLSTAKTLSDGLYVLKADEPDAILLDYSLQEDGDCGRSITDIRSSQFGGPIHVWSNHDQRIVSKHPQMKHAASFFQKQDYIGMRMRQLVREHFCAPLHAERLELFPHQAALLEGCHQA